MDQDISSGYGSGFGTLLLEKHAFTYLQYMHEIQPKAVCLLSNINMNTELSHGRVLYFPKFLFIVKILPCRRSGIKAIIACLRFRMDARMIDSGYFTVYPASYPEGFTITLIHQPKNSGLLNSEEGKQSFFEVRKSKIRKGLGSFRYRKSENFLGVPVYKLQSRKFS
jgi:hypothetical protein